MINCLHDPASLGSSSRARRSQKGWTPERRARQAASIARWRPWRQSTGPRTVEGKTRASANAFKHGCRSREHIEKKRETRAILRIAARNIAIAKVFLRARSAGIALDASYLDALTPCPLASEPASAAEPHAKRSGWLSVVPRNSKLTRRQGSARSRPDRPAVGATTRPRASLFLVHAAATG